MIDRIQAIKLSITIGGFYTMKYPANDSSFRIIRTSVSYVSVFYTYYLRFRRGKIKNVQFLIFKLLRAETNAIAAARIVHRVVSNFNGLVVCCESKVGERKREKERRRGRGRIVEASETLIRTVGSFAAIAPPMRGGSTSPYPVSAQLNFSFHSPGTVLSRSPA